MLKNIKTYYVSHIYARISSSFIQFREYELTFDSPSSHYNKYFCRFYFMTKIYVPYTGPHGGFSQGVGEYISHSHSAIQIHQSWQKSVTLVRDTVCPKSDHIASCCIK